MFAINTSHLISYKTHQTQTNNESIYNTLNKLLVTQDIVNYKCTNDGQTLMKIRLVSRPQKYSTLKMRYNAKFKIQFTIKAKIY